MNDSNHPVTEAYYMQRMLGRRLQAALKEIVDEKLPTDIAILLRELEERSPPKPRTVN